VPKKSNWFHDTREQWNEGNYTIRTDFVVILDLISSVRVITSRELRCMSKASDVCKLKWGKLPKDVKPMAMRAC
jgi:hypothetical protein